MTRGGITMRPDSPDAATEGHHRGAEDATGLQLGGLLDALPFYVLVIDADHRILSANQAVRQDLGLEPSQIVGGYCPKVVHGLNGPFPGCPLEEAKEKGCSIERELFDPRFGRWVQSAIYPTSFRTQDGRAIYMHMVQDITERKRAEEENQRNNQVQSALSAALHVSLMGGSLEEQLGLILPHVMSIPWLSLEPKGCILLVEDDPSMLVMKAHVGLSAAVRSMCARVPFGQCLCGRAALSGEIQFADCLDDRHENVYEGMSSHGHYCVPILSGGRTLGVANLYLREGHVRDAREEEALRAAANVLAGIIERKQTEARFLQAQKMEAVGRLAGGVAHDFNNLLTVIHGFAEFAQSRMPQNSAEREEIGEVLKAAERATNLTRQLLAFSRRQMVEMRVLNLNTILDGMAKMLQRILGEDVSLQMVLAPDLGSVKADSGQIEQVVLNLAVNARDAMPQGGTLTLQTANVEVCEDYTASHPDIKTGSFVVLSSCDTGCGMTPEVQAHLFEPFFTTKGVGKGTGLGLAAVYGIVTQSGGHIDVSSTVGQGTTFRIRLPRVEEQPAQATMTMAAAPRGSEIVLLVEDEPVVRALSARMLRSLGYDVLEAVNGTEALALLQARGETVDLVFTDLVMPGMSGRELAERVRQVYPVCRILYTSGYTDDAIVQRGDMEAGAHMLQKPYALDSLARAVRQALERA